MSVTIITGGYGENSVAAIESLRTTVNEVPSVIVMLNVPIDIDVNIANAGVINVQMVATSQTMVSLAELEFIRVRINTVEGE
jgi:hypothetical protein